MKRFVFLDIDGPMCNARSLLASGAIGVTRYFDPVAVNFLNQLYIATPYRVVVTSTWRKEVFMPILLPACGVLAPCHADWSTTTDIVSGSKTSMDDRPYQINQWLDDHELLENGAEAFHPKEHVKCIILDDDSFNWASWQEACWVKADCYDGIPLMQMNKAFELFDTYWPAKNRAYPE